MRCILGAECCFRSAGREAGAGDGGSGKPASDFGRADRRRRGRLPRDTGGGIAVGNGVGNRTGSGGAPGMPGMRGLCRFGDDSWRGCMPVVRRGGTVRGCGAVGCERDFFRASASAFCEVCTQGAVAGEESSAQRIGKSGKMGCGRGAECGGDRKGQFRRSVLGGGRAGGFVPGGGPPSGACGRGLRERVVRYGPQTERRMDGKRTLVADKQESRKTGTEPI